MRLSQNFLHLGIIAMLFPMARVIHCVRDPLDTCLACYFQESGDDHPYAHALADLGAYYRQYQGLMIHWGEVLDIPILEVRYEGLVRDPKKLTRTMVEFCGLKWDKRCMELYKGKQLCRQHRSSPAKSTQAKLSGRVVAELCGPSGTPQTGPRRPAIVMTSVAGYGAA